jgi:hypothetical protein
MRIVQICMGIGDGFTSYVGPASAIEQIDNNLVKLWGYKRLDYQEMPCGQILVVYEPSSLALTGVADPACLEV